MTPTEIKKEKVHHCFNCGEETENWDEMPNGRKLYVCNSPACEKELRYTAQCIESEAREDAEQDGYSRYY